jgi:hypothetical protein
LLAIVSSNSIEQVDRRTIALLYEYKHHFDETETLLTINSEYQKVEVIKNEDRELYLYLDGLLNLKAFDLEDLNCYIAETPFRFIKPEKTLIVGNGAFSSVSKFCPHSKFLQSLKFDAGILLAGHNFFTPTEELKGLGP